MAKGARKKTKWVSLSLASATSTVPPAEHETTSKSSRGTKKTIHEDASCPGNSDSKDFSNVHSSDRRSSWNNTNGYSPQQGTEESIGQPYSNGYHSQPPRNYSSHFKSHYNRNSYYHNGSSRKPHYNSYNGNGSYRKNSNDQYTAEAKNEQNGAVIINEDEYTKITTPRQDVLFKKGYLSRPKKHTTTSTNGNENGVATGSSSMNGTTDGSDVATASGSVSTAESVTSDSAYLTDGHLLDYPAPLPYFGYIDQSGVLVMNGFAVDNSGYPYMNGGQTYIYPTNYHCQSSFTEDDQTRNDNVDGGDLAASDDDKNLSNDAFDDAEVVQAVPDTLQENTEVCLLKEQTNLNSISEEIGQEVLNDEEDSADLNQQVPQQPMLLPFANSFDYAPFYNAFYYPDCMVAPYPVMANEMYCDQFGGMSEEEHARQQSFRKRKKRYRNWDEYPAEFFPDGTMIDTIYQYPNVLCIPETEVMDSTEVPVDGIISDPTSTDQAVPTHSSTTIENTDIAGHNSTNELPSSQQSAINSTSLRPSKPISAHKLSEPSQHLSKAPKVPGRQRSQAQKIRKKDLIESTRAFAEQNIDLTRPASLLRPAEAQQNESSEWRTVRNGKEVTIEEDRKLRSADTKNLSKEVSESPSNVKLFYDECKPEESLASCDSTTTVSEEIKRPKKETIGRKGKKTAKGKGKKSKKNGLTIQQKGFELIEPEFPVSELSSNESELVESTDAVDEVLPPIEDAIKEEADESEHEVIEAEQEIEHSSISNRQLSAGCTLNLQNDEDYDVECLEQDFRDIQLCDLQIETADHVADQQEEVIDVIDKECEILNIPDESTVQIISQGNLEHVDTHVNDELHEVPSELVELACLTVTSNLACVEDMNLIENKMMENCHLPFNPTELSSPVETVQFEHEDDVGQQKRKHFSNDEYLENIDSGVQSPAAFTSSSSDSKERKSSTSSFGSQEIQLTDAVTKWLSETLSNKRLEELFVLPEDPILLHRIHQFNVLHFDESLVLSSDTYSSSSCDEAEDSVDSDYMSDAQAKNREVDGLDGQQKTELKKDQLAKQTANGHRLANDGDHSNHKQKRCIIM